MSQIQRKRERAKTKCRAGKERDSVKERMRVTTSEAI